MMDQQGMSASDAKVLWAMMSWTKRLLFCVIWLLGTLLGVIIDLIVAAIMKKAQSK